LVGSVLGGLIICITPLMSSKITKMRNGKLIPYQGIMLTIGLLVVIGTIIQLTI